MRRLIIILLSLIVFSFALAYSKVSFVPKSIIIFPDSLYVGSSTDFRFVDLNKDGTSEILIENDSLIASYWINSSKTVDYFLKKHDTLSRRYVAGYFDFDNLLDYVEVVLLPFDGYPYPAPSDRAKAITYLSGNGFQSSDSIELFNISQIHSLDPVIAGIGRLFLRDLNNDDYPELYGQIMIANYDCEIAGGLCYNETLIRSFKWVPGSDSVFMMAGLPHSQMDWFHLYNDTDTNFVEINEYLSGRCYESGGTMCDRYFWFDIEVYSGDSLLCARKLDPIYGCPDPDQMYWQNHWVSLLNYWVGDALAGSPGYKMLAKIRQKALGNYRTPEVPACDVQSMHLACFDLSSPDSVIELWNVTLFDSASIDFIFSDTDFIDKFFTYGENHFHLHESRDGEPIDSSDVVGSGEDRMVAYRALETGGQQYAIMQEANILKLYAIDIVTSVADTRESIIPASFRLGRPFPNPYNAQLTIPIYMASKASLKVEAFDVLGRKVDEIFSGNVESGDFKLQWDSERFPSGIYFIRASTGTESAAVKTMLLK